MNEDLKPLDDVSQKSTALLADLKDIISRGKLQAVAAVNSTLTLTYWHVGQRINDEVLRGKRAAYGKQVIASVATKLVERFGRSFEARNLRRMMQFAEVFPDFRIVSPLVSQLSWTHFTILMELYLNWLDKYERQPDEATPIGLILCAQAGTEQVELMNLQKDNIMVAEYWTELPAKEVLEKKTAHCLDRDKNTLGGATANRGRMNHFYPTATLSRECSLKIQ